MKSFHTLINLDKPLCLYCQATCATKSDSSIDRSNGGLEVCNIFWCEYCKESFSAWHQGDNEDTFIISCFDLTIYQDARAFPEEPMLGLQGEEAESTIVWIPYFEIDFSDRDALYQKLKTYLIFS